MVTIYIHARTRSYSQKSTSLSERTSEIRRRIPGHAKCQRKQTRRNFQIDSGLQKHIRQDHLNFPQKTICQFHSGKLSTKHTTPTNNT